MQAPTRQIIHRLNDLAHGANSVRLNPESQEWASSADREYQIMNNELGDAYRSWRYGRHASDALYHLENVTDRMKVRLSDDYKIKYESSLAYFRGLLYVMVELVDATGGRFRDTATYVEGSSVASILQAYTASTYVDIAYGVKIIEPGVAWTIRPSRLKWVMNRPWHEHMTMQELFHNVPKADNERYYIVVSKLDVKTKYTDQTVVRRVHNAVYWLNDLYRDMQGRLRSLKELAQNDE